MATEKYTYAFNGYFPYDYKALEQEINERAAKGQKLVSLGRYFAKYTTADMTGLRAVVEVFTGAYEKDNEKKLSSYRNSRREKGWKLAAEMDFFYIWYAPEDAKPKRADMEAEYNLMQKMVWSRELTVLALGVIALILGIVAICKCSYTDFLTFTGVGSLLLAPLFILPSIVVALVLFSRIREQSAYLKQRERLPEPDIHRARQNYRILYTYFLALSIYILLVFLLDAVFGYTRYLTLIIPLLLACLGAVAVQRIPNEKLRKPLLLILLVGCGVAMLLSQQFTPEQETAPTSMENVLTIESVTGEEASRTYYRKTVSPMVTSHFVYTETDENGAQVQNEYFHIPLEISRKLVIGKVKKLMQDKQGISDADPSQWNVDEAYAAEDGALLLIRGSDVYYYAAVDKDDAAAEYTVPLK